MDALLFRLGPNQHDPPCFITVPVHRVEYCRWQGWIKLADEREIRQADAEDVHAEEERTWQKRKRKWHQW